jgi:hypothetical protein
VQVGAFLLARYLVRDLVVHYVSKKWPKWELVDHMLVRIRFKTPCSCHRGSHEASCSVSRTMHGLIMCLHEEVGHLWPSGGRPSIACGLFRQATQTMVKP